MKVMAAAVLALSVGPSAQSAAPAAATIVMVNREPITQEETNMTRKQLRANLARTLIASRVQREEGLAHVSFTDEDLRRYFDTHLDEFPLQTFERAKSDVIERLKSDASSRHTVLAPPIPSVPTNQGDHCLDAA